MEGYTLRRHTSFVSLVKKVGDDLYSFSIDAYHRSEPIEREGDKIRYRNIYEKVYLRSYKHTGDGWTPACELDISDCLTDNLYFHTTMRLIENNLIVLVNKSLVIIDVSDPGRLKLIDKKPNALKRQMGYRHDRRKKFAIPLIPVEEISSEERIRLSIDRYYHYNDIYETSMVDIHNKQISFFRIYYDDIARFDVTGWDDENIYCKFGTARPFTILEQMIKDFYFHRAFVKGGKLYCPGEHTLMVFDIRSNQKIRKLGHFVRMDYRIEDIAVLDDGNILLYMYWSQNLSKSHNNQSKRYLCLLENPQ